MTTHTELTAEQILDAFAKAGDVLPRVAMRQAVEHWGEVGPVLLSRLHAYADATDRSERNQAISFYCLFLAAQMRDSRAFASLCAIARDGDELEAVIGDAVTEDFAGILVRTFNGDLASLHAIIEDADAYEFLRAGALDALAWLAATDRVNRSDTARYLRDLFTTLQPQADNFVWVGWQRAIAQLGLAELTSLVKTAFDRLWIDDSIMTFRHFEKDLKLALDAADPKDGFSDFPRYEDRLDDAVTRLSTWHSFQPTAKPAKTQPLFSASGQQPASNPYRNVGRNDPCPCGSGKKFKKCCLDKVS